MWQSDVANAQQAAFRLVVIIAIVLIFLVQPDEDRHV
jgi:predicted small integral membrane protein